MLTPVGDGACDDVVRVALSTVGLTSGLPTPQHDPTHTAPKRPRLDATD